MEASDGEEEDLPRQQNYQDLIVRDVHDVALLAHLNPNQLRHEWVLNIANTCTRGGTY